MAEATSNIEFAHRVHEHDHEQAHDHQPGDRRHEWAAIAEAVVLAVVAIATAWSGYQAAKWDALSAKQYALNDTMLVLSQEKATLAGQEHLYDATTFNGWMFAMNTKSQALMDFYRRRFRPEYREAFEQWIKLDPLHNPDAPPGPYYMPGFKDTTATEAARLTKEAKDYFNQAVESREIGDRYVKVTVLLATVLLLTALSQRFRLLGPRVVVITVAMVLLLIGTGLLAQLPRAAR